MASTSIVEQPILYSGSVFLPKPSQLYYCNRVIPDENGIARFVGMNLGGGRFPASLCEIIQIVTKTLNNEEIRANSMFMEFSDGKIATFRELGDRFSMNRPDSHRYDGKEVLIINYGKEWAGQTMWFELIGSTKKDHMSIYIGTNQFIVVNDEARWVWVRDTWKSVYEANITVKIQ